MKDANEILQTIARAVEISITGRLRDVRRNEMITKAREACDRLGLDYSQATLIPTRVDQPYSAPKHINYRRSRSRSS